MPVKEKRLLSLRYLWRIFTYAYNISFIILALSVSQTLFALSDYEVMRKLYHELTDGIYRPGNTLNLAKVIAAAALLACVGILFVLRRLLSNELAAREKTERLMAAVGYRKKDIILYEEGYVMFDMCCGYAVAVVITLLCGVFMKKIEIFSAICRVLGRWNCMTLGAYAATALIIVIFIGADVALWGAFGMNSDSSGRRRNVSGTRNPMSDVFTGNKRKG